MSKPILHFTDYPSAGTANIFLAQFNGELRRFSHWPEIHTADKIAAQAKKLGLPVVARIPGDNFCVVATDGTKVEFGIDRRPGDILEKFFEKLHSSTHLVANGFRPEVLNASKGENVFIITDEGRPTHFKLRRVEGLEEGFGGDVEERNLAVIKRAAAGAYMPILAQLPNGKWAMASAYTTYSNNDKAGGFAKILNGEGEWKVEVAKFMKELEAHQQRGLESLKIFTPTVLSAAAANIPRTGKERFATDNYGRGDSAFDTSIA